MKGYSITLFGRTPTLVLTLTLALAFSGTGCVPKTAPEISAPMQIIFETDMGNDVDDALALDMLYKYVEAGKIDLVAIMTNKASDYSAAYIDLMNTWYGHPEIPIGILRDGAFGDDANNYAKAVAIMQDNSGAPLWPRTVQDVTTLPDAHTLYRRLLADRPDGSVTIVSVGFSTNLARLLDTPADDISPLTGVELVAKKVKLLCTMAGCFNDANPREYNVDMDIPAAQKVFDGWPTPIVTSPFEVGIAIEYPGESIVNDFGWAPLHPMVEGYKHYLPMPYDRPTWDLTSVLYAVEGPSWFGVSPAGKISVDDNAGTTLIPDAKGEHRYLTVDAVQAEAIRRYFVETVSAPPARYKTK